jgi:hypothetical protein
VKLRFQTVLVVAFAVVISNCAGAQLAAEVGDVYVGTCDAVSTNTQLNEVDVYTASGQFVTALHGPSQNTCMTGMTFGTTGNLRILSTPIGSSSARLLEIDNVGALISNAGPFTSPISITHDQQGNFYLGQGNIIKIAPNGSTTSFTVAGGANWITMAADQHRIFYSANNGDIKSFDVATQTQGPDIAHNAMARTVRALPDNSILVDSQGAVIHWVPGCAGCLYHDVLAYQIPANADSFSLDPDGVSFWSINTFYDAANQLGKGDVYRTDIKTGDAMGSFSLQPLTNGRFYSKSIGVNGDGINSTVGFTPSSLTFPGRAIGTTSPAKSVTVSNSGSAQVVVSSVTVTGDFALKNNLCQKGIPPGGSCTIAVTFTPTQVGTRTGTLKIFDNATNSPQGVSLSGFGKGATATSLTSSLNPSTYGQAVTFTAHVTTNAPTAPTGKVTFLNGTDLIGTATVSGGFAVLTRSNFDVGTLAVTARYNGDTANVKSTSPVVNQMVVKASTTTTVVSSRNPSKLGNSVRFTATVQSATVTPTGTVTFMAGATSLGTVGLGGGHASVTTSALPAGSTTVTVTYSGTSNINGSAGSVVQTVN